MMTLLKNKRFILTIILAAIIAAYFWSSSRYPALNEKAMMGANTQIEAIGFDIFINVPQGASLTKRIIYNSINWMYTNRKGMTFGIIFGALLMTLLPFLQRFQFRSRFANSLMGVVMGSPLGLCVNCSTPVAQGIYQASGRVETMLAAMVSSPTLNIVVLTMLFSLFPFYLATIKLGFTVGFILIGIPLLTRSLSAKQESIVKEKIISAEINKQLETANCPTDEECEDENVNETKESWLSAFLWLIKNGVKNLWYVFRLTVPLMILAGILGAAVVTILPFETLISQLPQGRIGGLFGMMFVAIFGIFLPVPMAFDVIVTAILLNAGMPVKYAAVLLFTLGVFSVYPFSMIWKTVSWKLAVSVLIVLSGIGVVAGAVASRYYQWDYARQENYIIENFTKSGRAIEMPQIDRTQQGVKQDELLTSLKSYSLKAVTVSQANKISIDSIPFSSRSPQDTKMFSRIYGNKIGITEHENYSLLKLDFRYSISRGIASGDFNNDGWQDIVISSDAGFGLYANKQGREFIQQRIEIPELNNYFVGNVAFVDMNNDGWLDLYFSTLRNGNYVIYNSDGKFTKEKLRLIPNHPDAVMTSSPAFGDIDRDGDLDIVLGNVSVNKVSMNASFNSSKNVWLKQNENQSFEILPLTGINGETLTSLLSDFNSDGILDLTIGNDMEQPDYFYLGTGKDFRQISNTEGLIPHTTLTTMSMTTADIDNDLKPEIYIGQIARREKLGMKGHTKTMTPQEQCAELVDKDSRDRCENFMTFKQVSFNAQSPGSVLNCSSLPTQAERDACVAYKVIWYSNVKHDESYCNLMPANWEYLSYVCHKHYASITQPTADELSQGIPQKNARNVLLKLNGEGKFEDKAKMFGLELGGWSWNAKFSDLDNDGFQDIYIVNGYVNTRLTESNYLYMNREGKSFEDITAEGGLTSYLDTLSFTYIDFDNDGDLDIISVPTVGPISVYKNNSVTGNAISFELRDETGNRFGIGSKIFIYYGDNGKQMREIQASGGYQSFDSPIVHFGLGDMQTVNRVEIEWSTGEKSVIESELKAGARYIITRQK